MANDANYGFEHRFSFGASPATFSGSSTRFDIVSSSVKKQGEQLDSTSALGVRTRRDDRRRDGLVRVGGQIVLDPSFRIWDFFLPFILGAAEATDTFNVADSLTGFDMLHDPFGTGSNATKFGELYVNRASLRFGPGLLKLTLDVIGKTATAGQAYAGAALGSGIEYNPLVFYDTASGFSIQSGVIAIEEGELVIDNVLDVKFRNSQTAVSIRATDQIISLVTNIPLTPTTWTTYFGDKSSVDATITLARANMSSVITLFNLSNPDEGPGMPGKGEVPLILRSVARSDSSDPSIRVTNDPVNT